MLGPLSYHARGHATGHPAQGISEIASGGDLDGGGLSRPGVCASLGALSSSSPVQRWPGQGRRDDRAIDIVGEREAVPNALRTDGSMTASGGAGGVYAFYNPGESHPRHVIGSKRGPWRDRKEELT